MTSIARLLFPVLLLASGSAAAARATYTRDALDRAGITTVQQLVELDARNANARPAPARNVLVLIDAERPEFDSERADQALQAAASAEVLRDVESTIVTVHTR